jgi:hypothetical protein
MGSLNDKVRKARRGATNLEASITAGETVNRNAKTAGVRLSMAEERAAKKVLQPRIKIDRSRTAARAVGIEKMQEKKAAAKRMAAAVGNAPASKKSKASKSLTGEKAAEALKKRTSRKGVKEFEKRASKALDKKYPGLYKKNKGMK